LNSRVAPNGSGGRERGDLKPPAGYPQTGTRWAHPKADMFQAETILTGVRTTRKRGG